MDKLLGYFREAGRFARLAKIASSEPPRVRAMLGAIAQQLGHPANLLATLRKQLNPFTQLISGLSAHWSTRGNGRRRSAGAVKLFEHPDFEQAVIRELL